MSASTRVFAASACACCVAALVAACGGAAFEAGSGDGGGPSPQDGGTPDADAETSNDGSTTHDAADGESPPSDGAADANDATDGGDGAPPIFACSAQDAGSTFFCADFDHVAAVGDGWNATLGVNGGTNAFDTVHYRSPPNGYAATTTAVSTGATFAALNESIPTATIPSTTPLDLAFSLLMRDIDPTVTDAGHASATLVTLEFTPLLLSVVLTGSELTLQQTFDEADGGTLTASGSMGGIATDLWTRAEIDVDRSVTPWTIVIKRDSVVKLSTTAIVSPTGDTGIQITLGIVYVAPPSAGYGATYDDVILQSF